MAAACFMERQCVKKKNGTGTPLPASKNGKGTRDGHTVACCKGNGHTIECYMEQRCVRNKQATDAPSKVTTYTGGPLCNLYGESQSQLQKDNVTA